MTTHLESAKSDLEWKKLDTSKRTKYIIWFKKSSQWPPQPHPCSSPCWWELEFSEHVGQSGLLFSDIKVIPQELHFNFW